MMIKEVLFFLILLSSVVEAGPVTCAACVSACCVGCMFTLIGAGICIPTCVETACAVPCLIVPF